MSERQIKDGVLRPEATPTGTPPISTAERPGRLNLTILADSNLDRDWLKVIETGLGGPTELHWRIKQAIVLAVTNWLDTGATVHPCYPCPDCDYWPSPVADAIEYMRGCEHECHTYKEVP